MRSLCIVMLALTGWSFPAAFAADPEAEAAIRTIVVQPDSKVRLKR
jgi:hypothetical protein